jgi:hypothetical protein
MFQPAGTLRFRWVSDNCQSGVIQHAVADLLIPGNSNTKKKRLLSQPLLILTHFISIKINNRDFVLTQHHGSVRFVLAGSAINYDKAVS